MTENTKPTEYLHFLSPEEVQTKVRELVIHHLGDEIRANFRGWELGAQRLSYISTQPFDSTLYVEIEPTWGCTCTLYVEVKMPSWKPSRFAQQRKDDAREFFFYKVECRVSTPGTIRTLADSVVLASLLTKLNSVAALIESRMNYEVIAKVAPTLKGGAQ